MLSRTVLCAGLLTCPEKSYRVCSMRRRPWTARGCCAMGEGNTVLHFRTNDLFRIKYKIFIFVFILLFCVTERISMLPIH